VLLNFSDYLGNRRILANLSSIDSFSNFDLLYIDLTHRTQWQVELFDNRSFYVAEDTLRGTLERGRTAYQVTGAVASLVYPFSFYHRAEIGAGYVFRKANLQAFVPNQETGELDPILISISDDFPVVQGALVGDSAVYAEYGGVAGRRWRLNANYAPNLKQGGGAVTSGVDLDFRQYLPITRRSNLAMRLFAGASSGNNPSPYYFGGLDTLRGSDLYEFAGDRAFFANLEYRFPLIDILASPTLSFQGIRGNIFVDVGGAWYHDAQSFRFYDSETGALRDAIAAYGFGLTVQLFGLDLNWDFARRWNLKESLGRQTSFWIGARF